MKRTMIETAINVAPSGFPTWRRRELDRPEEGEDGSCEAEELGYCYADGSKGEGGAEPGQERALYTEIVSFVCTKLSGSNALSRH
jgi:hypothetical protein